MAIQNLRSEESAPEPATSDARDGTPPGLDALRAWLGKPRPRLRGVWLWIRWIARQLRRGADWTARNAAPAARRTAELASRSARAARQAARVGRAAGEIGTRLSDIGQAWRGAGGRAGRTAAKLHRAARGLRDFSGRLTRTARGAADIGESVARLGRELGEPAKTAGASNRAAPNRTAPNRAAPKRAAPDEAARRPPPRRTALPEAKPKAALPEPVAAPPQRARAPETSAPALPVTPAPSPDPRAAALETLPPDLRVRIRSLGGKPRKARLREVILALLRERDWTTPAELGLFLGRGARNLARRHLGPMCAAGQLERRYPERASHPAQAYRARSALPAAPGSDG